MKNQRNHRGNFDEQNYESQLHEFQILREKKAHFWAGQKKIFSLKLGVDSLKMYMDTLKKFMDTLKKSMDTLKKFMDTMKLKFQIL